MTDPVLTDHTREVDEIGAQVITLLTRAARLQRPVPDMLRGPAAAAEQPPRLTEPVDFAGFLVPVLAAVAANRGSVDALLAGRPSSWEAAALRTLLQSAGCENEELLASYRRDPIHIDVSIEAILATDVPVAPDPTDPSAPWWRPLLGPGESFDEQLSALEQADGDAYTALEARFADRDLADPEWSAAENRLTAESAARETALRALWKARYDRYLAAFRATVLARAAELGITVEIEVTGETDPDKTRDAARAVTDLWATDTLAAQLYEHAALHTPTELLTTDAPEETSR
ncbi:hypothetical protein ACFVVM_33030 [Nocardia sp. NPDC058176]|uniref:hypothetical protein n=1 Tax=Nocardia sp. NPDC058176 TaxID=3346368 RepID=UPI0036DB587A